MRPSRAGRPSLGRTARWKLATTSPRRMPSSHLQLLIPCGAIRRRPGRAVSPRPGGRCGCRRRIDRMLATDPKEQARARPTAKYSGAMSKPSRPGPRSPPTTPSNPLGRPRGSPAPRRRRNRSTTSPSRTPEPSFFTPRQTPRVERREPACVCWPLFPARPGSSGVRSEEPGDRGAGPLAPSG